MATGDEIIREIAKDYADSKGVSYWAGDALYVEFQSRVWQVRTVAQMHAALGKAIRRGMVHADSDTDTVKVSDRRYFDGAYRVIT